MNLSLPALQGGQGEAASQLREAAAAKKCWRCGCLHGALKAIEGTFLPGERPADLVGAIAAARSHLVPIQYDCLGCEVCFPALAINALEVEGDPCPAELPRAREGWPPLPGSYTVLRYQAPVAVCTLNDDALMAALATTAPAVVSIVGTMHTENLGIERVVENVIANPHIRYLVLCGGDARQTVGHLPGQSLVALVRSGIDQQRRIIGAPGKRPFLNNIDPAAVEHFRQHVEVVDLIECTDSQEVLRAVDRCAATNPGPSPEVPAPACARVVEPIRGYLPERMVSDPAGYFVIHVDRLRNRLTLEHYRNEGVMDAVITGDSAAELYVPAVGKGLVSRLDHAAYLGGELARAEHALKDGQPYVQDGAPEGIGRQAMPACGCGSSCGDDKP